MSAWDQMMRQLNETIDRAILGDPPRGIYSAVPVSTEPAPPVTVADIERTMQRIYEAGLPRQPRLEFRYGEGVLDQLLAGIPVRPVAPGQPDLDSVWGMPMIPDARLRPGEWRIVDEHGAVRSLNNPDLGVALVLPADWFGAAAHQDRLARLEREGWSDAAESGSLLDRIDAAVEAWERGPDAYRYAPELDG